MNFCARLVRSQRPIVRKRASASSSERKTRGSVVLIMLLVLIGLAGASWIYSRHRAEAKRSALEQQQRAEQLIEAQKQDDERKELEKRVAQAKQQQDALKASASEIDAVLLRWEDATKVALTSSRIALSGPVAALQAVRREADQLTVPPCMDQAKVALVTSMNSTIQGFLVFMRNELKIGDTLAQIDFDAAAKHMASFRESRNACPN